MLGLKSFRTVTYILSGIEAMHMMKKGRFTKGRKLPKIKKNSFINCF